MSRELKQRLVLYQQALIDYRTGNCVNSLSFGFCWYFQNEHELDIYDVRYFKNILPELWKQKPSLEYEKHYQWFPPYWAHVTGKTGRIECLEKAIELTKSQIDEYDKKTC